MSSFDFCFAAFDSNQLLWKIAPFCFWILLLLIFAAGCRNNVTRDNAGDTSDQVGDASPPDKIFEAAENGSVDEIKLCIEQGSDVNAVFVETNPSAIVESAYHVESTPIACAVQYNPNIDVAKYLITQGADVNVFDRDGNTLLHLATMSNPNVGLLKFLVEQGLDVNAKDGLDNTLLHSATLNSNIEILKYLIELGLDVNAKNMAGCTPLHFASQTSNDDVLKCLIEQGADVNAIDNRGKTPLQYAERDLTFATLIDGEVVFKKKNIDDPAEYIGKVKILREAGAKTSEELQQ